MEMGAKHDGETSKIAKTDATKKVDKSRKFRTPRRSKRNKGPEEAQNSKEEGLPAKPVAEQEEDARANEGAGQGHAVPVKKTGRVEGLNGDQTEESLEPNAEQDSGTHVSSWEIESADSSLKQVPRKEDAPEEHAPSMGEMWKLMKDMMSQMAELSRNVTMGPRETVPTKPLETPKVREKDQPLAPTSRGKVEYLTVLDHVARLGTKNFKGGSDPIAADEWRSRLVRNFKSTRCPPDYQKDIAVHFLEGDAHNWWLATEMKYGDQVNSFSEFEKEFNRKYFPAEARDKLETEYLDLVQGRRTVREYEESFSRLRRYVVRELEPEEVQVRRFMRGLRPDIRISCSVCNFASVAELVEKAVLIEEGLADRDRTTRHDKERHNGTSASKKRKNVSDESGRASDRVSCAKCGKAHSGQCWKKSQGANEPSEEFRACFRCKKVGHLSRDCPERDNGKSRYPDQGGQEPSAKRHAGTSRVYELAKDPETSGQYKAITGKAHADT